MKKKKERNKLMQERETNKDREGEKYILQYFVLHKTFKNSNQ
jgi:hypothetical protein